MTKPRGKHASNRNGLDQALAAIISSTRTKTRSLSLTQLARWLDLAVSKLGSYKAVAERVGVSPKMLRQFSYVTELAGPVREMFHRRQLDSVDAAAHLKLIPRREQAVVARALAKGDLDTSDVRAVAQLRRVRAGESISSIVDAVRDTKTKRQFVVEFIIRGAKKQEEFRDAFQKYISPQEIIALDVDGPFGRLILSARGKDQLFRAAKDLGVQVKDVVPEILRSDKRV